MAAANNSMRFLHVLSARAAEWTAARRTVASLGVALCVASVGSVLPSDDVRLDAASSARSSEALAFHHGNMNMTSDFRPLPLMGRYRQPARLQQEYEVAGVIGEGGFGLVRAAMHKSTKKPVAVKTMKKDHTSQEKFWQEVAILKQLDGQHNVLQLHDAFETTDSYVLVTELVEGGELFDHLMATGVFAECKAKQLVQQVCHALSYMHSRNVVHADIKPENILISDDTAEQMQVRLIDFGVAYRQHDLLERLRSVHDGLGTVAYAAPEFITMQESGCAVDMWALGVVLYVILAGRHPFDIDNDATDAQLKERILAGEFDMEALNRSDISEDARDLIHRLLVVDPAKRLTAVEALEHAWLAAC